MQACLWIARRVLIKCFFQSPIRMFRIPYLHHYATSFVNGRRMMMGIILSLLTDGKKEFLSSVEKSFVAPWWLSLTINGEPSNDGFYLWIQESLDFITRFVPLPNDLIKIVCPKANVLIVVSPMAVAYVVRKTKTCGSELTNFLPVLYCRHETQSMSQVWFQKPRRQVDPRPQIGTILRCDQ